MFASDKRSSLVHKVKNYMPKIFVACVRNLKMIPLLVKSYTSSKMSASNKRASLVHKGAECLPEMFI